MADNNKKTLPSDFDGERRQTDDLAPENENSEQVGAYDQAQTVADQAQGVSTSILNSDSEHAPSGLTAPDAQDVVDHMNQMERGNTVDMSAYRGEPNHDDNVDKYGKPAKLDGLRGDGT
ncbi:hypothetical protein AAG593_00250 [Citromicrobium bathyomarinum]|jgi:hypothetical protein|uniref:Uncharacterized protein n=1 Tax=Alteriqipengyuania abyssalis TaxID=2860200 RepID=A0ABS7PCY9_9SPHN|nr:MULTISPECIES: hypothetical protein [Sphingomonadales]MAO03917.1 hypothetical protein [Citromicrobium sp.]MEC8178351.1 hypothetical protein [Pseudomonadota bacterium]ALG59756.1 hypothetical protein WG74_01950 [Citromicrobium sp. JL477]KPM13111.1 hypothetical protein WG75_12750 [Citromicrobium sp. WPS32]KPM17150.1 hypothetical protein VO58_04565 [Citromicrobium sp. JL1351]|tara:strand:+ start:1641 stop:1997 length:357 start_codon:yes stop_codon:yes gene_type:complete